MLALVGIPASAQTPPQGKPGSTVRCWTERGQTVCGDTIPANAAGSAQREINASGVTVQTFPRPLTPTEQAAKDAADKAEAARLAAQASQTRQQIALASTYASEDALRKAYAERTQSVHAAMVAAQSSLASHRLELSRALLRAANLELQGKPVNKQLQDGIAQQVGTVNTAFTDLQHKRGEYAAMDDELQQALQKYRDYKQNGGIAPAVPQN
ncbi:hypothetical protein [Solilutibacter silvestris]|uniref:hypothetical protein n=1 Tax=Solilutibacter silvestris TaxID=1645665 RepID=UPI00101AD659|nr:hypothetical protein [Lysobacter silvestris]